MLLSPRRSFADITESIRQCANVTAFHRANVTAFKRCRACFWALDPEVERCEFCRAGDQPVVVTAVHAGRKTAVLARTDESLASLAWRLTPEHGVTLLPAHHAFQARVADLRGGELRLREATDADTVEVTVCTPEGVLLPTRLQLPLRTPLSTLIGSLARPRFEWQPPGEEPRQLLPLDVPLGSPPPPGGQLIITAVAQSSEPPRSEPPRKPPLERLGHLKQKSRRTCPLGSFVYDATNLTIPDLRFEAQLRGLRPGSKNKADLIKLLADNGCRGAADKINILDLAHPHDAGLREVRAWACPDCGELPHSAVDALALAGRKTRGRRQRNEADRMFALGCPLCRECCQQRAPWKPCRAEAECERHGLKEGAACASPGCQAVTLRACILCPAHCKERKAHCGAHARCATDGCHVATGASRDCVSCQTHCADTACLDHGGMRAALIRHLGNTEATTELHLHPVLSAFSSLDRNGRAWACKQLQDQGRAFRANPQDKLIAINELIEQAEQQADGAWQHAREKLDWAKAVFEEFARRMGAPAPAQRQILDLIEQGIKRVAIWIGKCPWGPWLGLQSACMTSAIERIIALMTGAFVTLFLDWCTYCRAFTCKCPVRCSCPCTSGKLPASKTCRACIRAREADPEKACDGHAQERVHTRVLHLFNVVLRKCGISVVAVTCLGSDASMAVTGTTFAKAQLDLDHGARVRGVVGGVLGDDSTAFFLVPHPAFDGTGQRGSASRTSTAAAAAAVQTTDAGVRAAHTAHAPAHALARALTRARMHRRLRTMR